MINIRFTSDTLPNDTFQVLQLEGEEQISRLFRFELRLVSRDPDIDFKMALEGQASLAITTQGETRYVHGMLSEFEQGAAWHSGLYEYRAVLVPRLWMMTQSVQNQIYQKQTVPDIVQGELDNIQSKGEHPLVMNGLTHADYEIHTVGEYDEREYVVQYRESDFNFISRLMEHEGIYYYFDHDESAEKLVITDIIAAQESTDQAPVHFQADAASTNYAQDIVYKLSRSQKQVPGSVLMKDFNYRSPSLPLHATDVVVPDGIGFVTEYGAHFKTPEEGHKLATIRAEEFRCGQNIYSGESHVGRFCCGHVYSLTNHFREDYNQDYLVTKVIHHASQAIESWGKVGGTSYYNEFSCIPADLQYRPQRLTPKPRLYGIMNGVIDSEQDMNRADIDAEGRYKVLMPFDISGAAPGKASRRIRMAQPYGGHGSGMSFPLVKGTEVIWTCIDGDIDRPIITGAVPNPLNPSVTTTDNHTSNVIKTSSGITMGFHDGSGSAGQNTTGGGAGGGLAAQQQYQSTSPELQSSKDTQNQNRESPELAASAASQDKTARESIRQQQQMMADDLNLTGKTRIRDRKSNGKQWEVLVPDYDETDSVDDADSSHNDTYLRLGKAPYSISGTTEEGLYEKDGWLDFTDGDHVSIVKGERTTHTYAGKTDIVEDDEFSYKMSNKVAYSLGHSFTSSMGMFGTAKTGLSVGTSVGINVALKYGWDFKFGMGSSFTFYKDNATTVSGSKTFEVDREFVVKVDPEDPVPSLEDKMENKVPKIAASLAAASSVASLAITAVGKRDGNTDGVNTAASIHAGAVYTAGTVLSLMALKYAHNIKKAKKSKKADDMPASRLELDSKKLELEVNGVSKDFEKGKGENKVKYKKDEPRIISLSTGINSSDKSPAKLIMQRTKDGGKIGLVAGKNGDSFKNSNMVFKVGKSSIYITDEAIYFNSPKYRFNDGEGKPFSGIDKKGLQVYEGNLSIEKDVNVKGKITVKGDVLAANVKSGGGSIGSPPPAPKVDKAENHKKQKDEMEKQIKSYLKVRI